MPEPPTNPDPVVYQLRVVLRGVSPLIWRRLLIRSDSTIADLHASLQLVLGWSDEHLNRFVVHGRQRCACPWCCVTRQTHIWLLERSSALR